MACEFSINYHQTAQELVESATQAISNAGGKFDGSTEAGMFELKTPLGQVAGNYTIQDNIITVVIGKKPILVSCNLIKTELTKYLSQ
jgi:hypothetical protein